MKKIAMALALAIVLSLGLSVVADAHVNGVREQYEWTVPKINPENPEIVFDGHVDLEGEWKGALCVTIDASPDSDTYEEVTIWPSLVWTGGLLDYNTFDEMPDVLKVTINTYYLWDDNGLYIASTCDNLGDILGHLSYEEYVVYLEKAYGIRALDEGEESATYNGMSGNAFKPMIYWHDETSDRGNTDYRWPSFWIGTIETGIDTWTDYDYTSCGTYYETSAYDVENWGRPDVDYSVAKAIRSRSYLSSAPEEDGFYHWGLEIFLPWEYLNNSYDVDEDGNIITQANLGHAGDTLEIGLIYSLRYWYDSETKDFVQLSNTMGWYMPDYYSLSATPAEKSDKVVETTPDTTEDTTPDTTEDTTPDTTEDTTPDTTTTTPDTTTTNPSTADVSVLFYALAAISAIGGISVFKRK